MVYTSVEATRLLPLDGRGSVKTAAPGPTKLFAFEVPELFIFLSLQLYQQGVHGICYHCSKTMLDICSVGENKEYWHEAAAAAFRGELRAVLWI